jgi:hypothetical protein
VNTEQRRDFMWPSRPETRIVKSRKELWVSQVACGNTACMWTPPVICSQNVTEDNPMTKLKEVCRADAAVSECVQPRAN